MVRAKFTVTSVTRTPDGGTVQLIPVTSGSKENEAFYRWTPGGSITLSTINEAALSEFIPGKAYYVDFELAAVPEPA